MKAVDFYKIVHSDLMMLSDGSKGLSELLVSVSPVTADRLPMITRDSMREVSENWLIAWKRDLHAYTACVLTGYAPGMSSANAYIKQVSRDLQGYYPSFKASSHFKGEDVYAFLRLISPETADHMRDLDASGETPYFERVPGLFKYLILDREVPSVWMQRWKIDLAAFRRTHSGLYYYEPVQQITDKAGRLFEKGTKDVALFALFAFVVFDVYSSAKTGVRETLTSGRAEAGKAYGRAKQYAVRLDTRMDSALKKRGV